MYITNDDLEVMIKMEHLLFSESKNSMFDDLLAYGECYFNDERITRDDLSYYWNLIEKLINIRKKKNEINSKRIAEKRKQDPFYARSKTEKIRISENSRRDEYIKVILDLQEEVRKLAEANYDYYSISEYESVVGDINDYQDNEFEDFKTDKDFKEYIKYLKHLVKEQ